MPHRLLPLAKRMRTGATDAERKMWQLLRAGRLQAHKFRRQQPLGDYIVDFVCFDKRLIVEIDGGQHLDNSDSDAIRTAWLESQGYRVKRYWNHDVLKQPDIVAEDVLRVLAS
jgi:very-short-patch-repair endonuclease